MVDHKAVLTSLGWTPASDRFSQVVSCDRPRVAFLAPPLETIPNPAGNAIYCLVERLVERFGSKAIAMAVRPSSGIGQETSIRDRLLYYDRSLKPSLILRLLPYRLKKQLLGSGAPELARYGRSAGEVLKALRIPAVIIEDTPTLVLSLASTAGPAVKKVLHQHCNAALGMRSCHFLQTCRSLDGLIFVAERGRKQAVQRHGHLGVPSRVIYNGVDLSHYSPGKHVTEARDIRGRFGIENNCSLLLFVGRLLPGKGVAESAEAFNRLGEGKRKMLIIGDGEMLLFRDDLYLRRLKTAVESSAGRIHLVGKIAQSELPRWYAASDAAIVPSLGAEGLPKVITEALAMGKPVLASDRGGAWELLREGQNGWLIHDPANIESTAQLLEEVLSDRRALLNMSKGILDRDRPLMSEDRMVAEFADTLEKWCNTSSSGR